MTWQNYLRTRTRQPEFLWRMVIWILAAGIGLGYVAEKIWQPDTAVSNEQKAKQTEGWDHVEQLAEQGDWLQVWWKVRREIYWGYETWGPTILATITGVCWLAFLLQSLQERTLLNSRLWCSLVAVTLGVLSIWPTGFFILWQEIGWGLRDSEELISGVRYNVFGIGLREEFAKLCCLLPLMPILLRWRSELAALLISACVGLGFAITENVSYFSKHHSLSVAGRFIMANPLHIALTGLIGLSVYRALRNPSGWGPHTLGMFGVMVFAHGLYDAFIDLPALQEYSIGVTIIFALVIRQFFCELRDLRKKRGDVVSLSANFLCGVSIVVAVTFVYLSATQGLTVAFESMVGSVFSLAVMVYLFLREMPETMVTV